MSRRTSTHPEVVALDLSRIADDCHAIAKEYREAYAYGFDRRDRHGAHVDKENRGQERVITSGESDPTGTIAVDQEWVRRETKAVAKLIGELETRTSTIKGRLSSVFKDRGPYERLGDLTIQQGDEKNAQTEALRSQRKRELQEEEKSTKQRLIHIGRELKELE